MKHGNPPATVNRPHPDPAAGHRSRTQIDLALLIGAVAGFLALAVHFELSEKVAHWVSGYENWQLDELPLTLLGLSIGLAWFAFRRVGEARREVAERIRAERQVVDLLAHNRELSQGLILAQESERRALARELHDEIGQDCTAIRAEAAFLSHALDDPQAAEASARRIARIAETLYSLVKDMLLRLRPTSLDSLGLELALQEQCESWEKQSGIACGFFPRAIPQSLDDALSITVFRLVQEGLTNVARHAGADQVRISLHPAADGESLLLTIADNGRGMANPEQPRPGFGLIGMRERIAGLHGSIELRSAAGQGLCITASLPLGGGAR